MQVKRMSSDGLNVILHLFENCKQVKRIICYVNWREMNYVRFSMATHSLRYTFCCQTGTPFQKPKYGPVHLKT